MKQSDVKKLISKIKIEYDKEFPASELGREVAMIVGFNKYKVNAVIKSLVEFQVIKPTESVNYYEWDNLDGLEEEEKEEGTIITVKCDYPDTSDASHEIIECTHIANNEITVSRKDDSHE